jgi:hypothetical protein
MEVIAEAAVGAEYPSVGGRADQSGFKAIIFDGEQAFISEDCVDEVTES